MVTVALLAMLASFEPMAAAVVLTGIIYLWTFSWKTRSFFAVQFAISVVALMAIPVFRLTAAENGLRVAVPVVLVLASAAVAVRIKPVLPSALTILLIIYFGADAIATSLVGDPNEWSFAIVNFVVAGAAIVFASAASKIGAWSIVARVLILAAACEAAIGLYEVFYLANPIWRGGRILADGSSTWIRNEVVASLPRAQGTFGHPLPFALTLALGAILVVRTRIWTGAVRFGLYALLASGVFVSGSRNAMILFVALTMLAFVLPSLLPRLHVIGVALLAGLVIAFPFLVEKTNELLDSGSVTHRLGAIESIPDLLSMRGLTAVVIGDGTASTPRLFSAGLLQVDGFNAVDNQYVLTLAQNGIVGLGILAAIIIIGIRQASVSLRILLIAIMVSGMIFDLLAWPAIAFWVWFLIAAAFAQMPGAEPAQKPLPRMPAFEQIR